MNSAELILVKAVFNSIPCQLSYISFSVHSICKMKLQIRLCILVGTPEFGINLNMSLYMSVYL